jgi:hypothetical protein
MPSHRTSEYLHMTVLENHRIVVDDRTAGDSKPTMQEYECRKCHRTEWSEAAPDCCGKKMSLKITGD